MWKCESIRDLRGRSQSPGSGVTAASTWVRNVPEACLQVPPPRAGQSPGEAGQRPVGMGLVEPPLPGSLAHGGPRFSPRLSSGGLPCRPGLGCAACARTCPLTAAWLLFCPTPRPGAPGAGPSLWRAFPGVFWERSRCGGEGSPEAPFIDARPPAPGLGPLGNFPREGQTTLFPPRAGNGAGHAPHWKAAPKERFGEKLWRVPFPGLVFKRLLVPRAACVPLHASGGHGVPRGVVRVAQGHRVRSGVAGMQTPSAESTSWAPLTG